MNGPELTTRPTTCSHWLAVLAAFLCFCCACPGWASGTRTELVATDTARAGNSAPAGQESPGTLREAKQYRWLFRERQADEPSAPAIKSTGLEQLDREIKEARRLYLAGEADNAILKYRSAVDRLESILNDTPPGDPLLGELEERFAVYDELATKILGPLHLEPKEEIAGQVFHLMEKRRICRRNLALKKAGILRFADVPDRLSEEESRILRQLSDLRSDVSDSGAGTVESELTSKLAQVRAAMQKSSQRFALLMRGVPPSLDQVRNDLLRDDELILDFNLLQDRLVVGVITGSECVYHQFSAKRAEIDAAVFNLQDKLREFTYGSRSSFMGHAWKEPCRRIYRALLGKLPPLPKDKPSVLVIPDRSLWYLPMSVMLDPEDRPLGAERLISLIPSADMLGFIRTSGQSYNRSVYGTDLLVFESIPWVASEEIREGTAKKTSRTKKMSEGEKIERLIMSNPVYPKPSEVVVQVQKAFKKFDVWVGQTATVDRLLDYARRSALISLLAVPLAVTDSVQPDRQPCFFFSPDKRDRRRFETVRMFAHPLESGLLVLPIAWFDMADRENPLGEGPTLLSTAMFYSGVNMGMINYSDPNWGADEPFLLGVLNRMSEQIPLKKALSEYKRELPAGLDSSFEGKPPSWTGWILLGDPGR
ncbi:MAG: CHAT domain-containing protein [Desulfomonilaceae bacterium]|nr:CHAT domain-containing protein [Desulfomonilaceae bacterium]